MCLSELLNTVMVSILTRCVKRAFRKMVFTFSFLFPLTLTFQNDLFYFLTSFISAAVVFTKLIIIISIRFKRLIVKEVGKI